MQHVGSGQLPGDCLETIEIAHGRHVTARSIAIDQANVSKVWAAAKRFHRHIWTDGITNHPQALANILEAHDFFRIMECSAGWPSIKVAPPFGGLVFRCALG